MTVHVSVPAIILVHRPRTVFDVEVDVDLVQHDAQWVHLYIGEHDELEVGGRLVVVQLVGAGAVRDKGVVAAGVSVILSPTLAGDALTAR